MAEDTLFRIALAPSAFFIWARYVSWPLVIIGLSMLIFFRIKPDPAWTARLALIQRTMLGLAVLLGLSLMLAYFMIPDHDKQIGVFWLGALLGSLPVLIPAAVAIFLSPMPRKLGVDRNDQKAGS